MGAAFFAGTLDSESESDELSATTAFLASFLGSALAAFLGAGFSSLEESESEEDSTFFLDFLGASTTLAAFLDEALEATDTLEAARALFSVFLGTGTEDSESLESDSTTTFFTSFLDFLSALLSFPILIVFC